MASEFAQNVALGTIRYSQVWEDHRLVEEGLALQPGDEVLSIASAGCNVLAMLLKEPKHITALDVNPAQAALFELKLAAIRQLEYHEFVALMGAAEGADRVTLLERIRQTLSAPARAFWDAHRGDGAGGLMHCGRLDTYFRTFQREILTKHASAQAIERLLDLADPLEQKALFEQTFNGALTEQMGSYFGPEMMAKNGRDPAQFRYVTGVDVAVQFLERFRFACCDIPTRDNFYLEYVLTSRYRDLERGPPYLRPGVFQKLKGLVDRVTIVTEDLEQFLRSRGPAVFDKVNLSDIFEYMSVEATADLLRVLARAIRPKGRLCYWNLLVPRSPPQALRDLLQPLTPLSSALWRRDRAFFYSAFHVEEAI